MLWKVGAGANVVVALAYLAITWAILRPLVQTRQVRSNPAVVHESTGD